MCAQAENVSPGTLRTQALLVPLETMNEKITDSLFQAIWFMGLKLLVAARPSISPGPPWDILETEPSTVLLAKRLGNGFYLPPNSKMRTDWVVWVCLVDVKCRKNNGKVCPAHLGTTPHHKDRSCFAFHCFRILAKVDFRNLCLLLLFLNDSLPLLTCNHFLFFFYSLSWFFLRSWSFVSLCWHFFLAWRTSLGIFSEKFCLQWIIFFFLHLKLTFIFPSFLKDIFTSYRVLGWQSFFPTLQLSPVH